jgi:hypothetical protein
MSKPAASAKSSMPGTMARLIKMLFSFFPVLLPLVMAGVILCGLINSIGAVFLQSALEVISTSWQTGDVGSSAAQDLEDRPHPGRHLPCGQPLLAVLEPLHGGHHSGLA